MKEIKINDINETTIYTWECLACGDFNEMYDDPNYSESILCDHCDIEYKIKH